MKTVPRSGNERFIPIAKNCKLSSFFLRRHIDCLVLSMFRHCATHPNDQQYYCHRGNGIALLSCHSRDHLCHPCWWVCHLSCVSGRKQSVLVSLLNHSVASTPAKVVPQPIAHSSSRVQPDYAGERTNLIPIPGHRSSPNPVTMEARSDNRSVCTGAKCKCDPSVLRLQGNRD